MTILGQNTVDELRDLVAAKDYTIAQIDKAYAPFASAWRARDASAAEAWEADFAALRRRYAAAKVLAAEAFTRAQFTVGVRDSLIPASVEYDAILKAIRKDPNVQSRGDLQDLSDRLAAQGVRIDYAKTPQPKAVDEDLQVYKGADTLLKKGEAAAEKAAKDWTPWLIGGGAVLGLFGLGMLTRRL